MAWSRARSPEARHAGVRRSRRCIEAFFRAFPDLTMRTDEPLIDGDRVVLIARFSGTDHGGFMGMHPTGRAVDFPVRAALRAARRPDRARAADLRLHGSWRFRSARSRRNPCDGGHERSPTSRQRFTGAPRGACSTGRSSSSAGARPPICRSSAPTSRASTPRSSQDERRFLLRDRGSRYGTFVNGEQVTERAARARRPHPARTDRRDRAGLRHRRRQDHRIPAMPSSDVTDLRQMAAILNGLRALGSGRVLDEVLTLVIDSALDVTKAERGFMMLANAEGELEFKIARGRGRTTLSGHVVHDQREDSARGVPHRAEPHRRRPDGRRPGGAARRHHRRRHPPRALRAAARDRDVGGRGIARSARSHRRAVSRRPRAQHDAVATRRASSLEAFATQAALAIESARLTPSRPRRRASTATCALPPTSSARCCRSRSTRRRYVDLAAASMPCRTVGGDFFDYLEVGERGFGFALGDVAGKGPPAALLAAAVQSNFAAQAPVSASPGGCDGAHQQGAAAARDRGAVRDDVLRRGHRRRAV